MKTSPDKNTINVPVSLGSRSYVIDIGHGLLASAGKTILPHLKRKCVAIVTDENVARHHLAALLSSLQAENIEATPIILPPGETTKSYHHLAHVCDALLAAGVERRDVVIAFGGGVIGDLAGFASAILRRGVNFIQVPTSLLAQVDSSVGGKTGINSAHGKNLIGAFHQPVHVIADLALLQTLPQRQRAAGYAEVVKYGLLGDASFFEWLDGHVDDVLAGEPAALAHAVQTSCKMKARIVAEDEAETGVRALLNLGHTFGHAYEAATGYSDKLLHGEAVAIGMVQAFRFSEMQGLCAAGTAERVVRHLQRARLPTHPSEIPYAFPPPEKLLELMRQDKKAVGGKLTFVLARAIGEAFVARDVADATVLKFLQQDQKTS